MKIEKEMCCSMTGTYYIPGTWYLVHISFSRGINAKKQPDAPKDSIGNSCETKSSEVRKLSTE